MSGRYALVIDNTEYTDPGLAQLATPGKDAEDFARILRDQDIGAFDDVSVLLNQPSFVVGEAIDTFFDQRKPDDLLVLYFSGHGFRDNLGALYLAVKNTNRLRLRSTAIKSDFIREAMDQSRSRRQVLILDCVNSGAFTQGTKAETGGSVGTGSAFEGAGHGRIILTASDSIQFAWEGDKVVGETEKSLFTHFLVKGMEGEADLNGDGMVTLDELYDYVYGQVLTTTPRQTPSKWSYRQEGEIVLRQITRREDIKPVSLPPYLISAIENSYSDVRLGAVQSLTKLLSGKNLGLARSAREALERMKEDDSRRVSEAARQALEDVHPDEQGFKPDTIRLARDYEVTRRVMANADIDKQKRAAAEQKAKAEEERLAREKAESLQAEYRKAERLLREKAEAEGRRGEKQRLEQKVLMKAKESTPKKKPTRKSNRTSELETSVAYPKLFSKRFASPFVLQCYVPEQRAKVISNMKASFQNTKINEVRQSSSVKPRQKVRVKFFSHAFEFSEPVIKVLDQEVNKFTFLGTPKDTCEPGTHQVLISITDEAGKQEFESLTVTAQVVDFAFDHISRPFLSRMSAAILCIGSFMMFLLGLLEQIDKTVGVTSGTAAGVLAVLVYGNFYNLYQRIRPNTP